MQTSVPLVTDLNGEPAETLSLYGVDRPETTDFGRGCLIARRLLERGVRFVQLFSGGTFGSPRRNWDGHEDMKANHGQEALRIDRPVAGLAPRPPPPRPARRHAGPVHHRVRPHAVRPIGGRRRSAWGAITTSTGSPSGSPARASSTASHTARPTRSAGKRPTDVVTWPDFHATVLHLLGIDHKRLTYYHNGIQRRLTNVHGEVVKAILA